MVQKDYKLADVAKHATDDDCWIVIHKKAYGVTKFLDDHPGGDAIITELAGKDATVEFEDIGHSEDARNQLKDYLKGDVSDAKDVPVSASGSSGNGGNTAVFVGVLAVIVAAIYYYVIASDENQ